ncbi:hypothetical protein Ade02nite_83980 [Paractinoplanes deccanensis]|uniref:Orc1-like AAA ATPase domain-containing protein n=1 Tax=Paractinoplanes deccanensis TaxID=113561 RepID=A0ABQ3YIG2_9ACTN|nr:ATP-binding protein [Actinoplanes deccanensis]GID79757.1 hypothetical protein Ade02nite_83980 [Actinoplanes deccanensis]
MGSESRQEGTVRRSLSERLRLARSRAFVGREEQVAAFGAAVRNDPAAALVFYLHGPGGVGKSTLVRHLADEARHATAC